MTNISIYVSVTNRRRDIEKGGSGTEIAPLPNTHKECLPYANDIMSNKGKMFISKEIQREKGTEME